MIILRSFFIVLLCFTSCIFSDARHNQHCNEKEKASRSIRSSHVHHGTKVKTSSPHNSKPKPAPKPHHHAAQRVLNVESFGAKHDNITDNFQALKKAWDKACSSSKSYTILVPKGKTYFVKHINFTGPCKSAVTMEIEGTIKAFPEMYEIPRKLWIKFGAVRDLSVIGGGTIDGNGEVWWNYSCRVKNTKPCQTQNAPTAVTFQNCTNVRVNNIKLVNAQQMHMNIQDSNEVTLSTLTVTAPEESPNTDGIHVTRSTHVTIRNSLIGTGDDCVSIVNGSRYVTVKRIKCGPGHGISIGSLGQDHDENHVSDVLVRGAMLTGTTNGVRIKTWEGGKGSASHITFEDIVMKNVSNPIVINQHYCDALKNKPCNKQKDAVAIENIMYRNITGTSATKVAVNFNCSDSVPCKNIRLENVNLKSESKSEKVEAICSQMNSNLVKNSFPGCPV